MNEASKTLEFPPPLTPSSHPFSQWFPLLTLTHMLQSFRGTAWRLHIHTPTRLERHGKTTSPLCDDISMFGRSSPTAAALLGWVCVSESEPEIDYSFNGGTCYVWMFGMRCRSSARWSSNTAPKGHYKKNIAFEKTFACGTVFEAENTVQSVVLNLFDFISATEDWF